MRTVVAAVASRGPLRPGLTVDSAAVPLWAALNWYTISLVCEQTVSSDEEFAAWLEQTLTALLLPCGLLASNARAWARTSVFTALLATGGRAASDPR